MSSASASLPLVREGMNIPRPSEARSEVSQETTSIVLRAPVADVHPEQALHGSAATADRHGVVI